MMTGKIRFYSVSDIHLKANHTPTGHIIKNLNHFIFHPEFAKLDLYVIAGDLFDQQVGLHEDVIDEITLFCIQLLQQCAKHNVMLRVLEGTPSHDRGQGKIFETLNEGYSINAKARYVEHLSIEYIEELGVNVLYVPDEYHATTDITKDAVIELLAENNLEQVDLSIMHGAFPHQYPPHLNLTVHDPEFYMNITKFYVCIGHVHLMSVYEEKILAHGSFDRLHHGEPGAKGFFDCTINLNTGERTATFIENEKAHIYLTIELVGKSDDSIRKAAKQALKDVPEGSNIRLAITSSQVNSPAIKDLLTTHGFNWSTKHVVLDNDNQVIQKPTLFKGVPIHANSVVGLMSKKLNLSGVNDTLIERSLELLETLK